MSLRRNSLVVTSGSAIRLLVSIGAAPAMIRLMGLENFGIWTVMNAAVAMASLTELGVSTALTTHLAKGCHGQDERANGSTLLTSFGILTILGIVAMTGFFLLSDTLQHRLFESAPQPQQVAAALTALSLLFVPRFVQQWACAAEAAALRYDLQIFVELFSTICIQAGLVVVAALGGSLSALAVFLVFSTCPTVLCHALVLSRIWHPASLRYSWSNQTARLLLADGAANWISNLGTTLFSQVDRILVNAILGPAAAGVYAATTSVVSRINEFSSLPLRVLQPEVAAAQANLQFGRLQTLLKSGTQVSGALAFGLVASLIVAAPLLTPILVGSGPQTAEATVVLRLVAAIYGLFSLTAAPYAIAIGVGRPRINAIWVVLGSLSMIALIAALSGPFGLIGAALGNAGFLLTLSINFQVARHLQVSAAQYWRWLRPSVVVIPFYLAFSSMLAATSLPLPWQVCLSVVAAGVLMAPLGGWGILSNLTSTFLAWFGSPAKELTRVS